MGITLGYVMLAAGSLFAYLYLGKRKISWKYRNYLPALTVIGMVCLVAGILEQAGGAGKNALTRLERGKAGAGETEVPLILKSEDLRDSYTYTVTVEEQKLTDAEAERVFADAGQELEQVILGENRSPEQITTDLTVPEQLQEGLVSVDCYFEPYELVEMDGTILWENLTGETAIVKVTAQMGCQEREAVHEFYLQLTPQPLEGTEAVLAEIKESIEAENLKQGEAYLSLPDEAQGAPLGWYSPSERVDVKLLLLGVACMAARYVYRKEKQERERKQWEQGLVLDYPDIVSQLSLLAGAGMTVPAAWSRLALDYRSEKERGHGRVRPGYEELLKTMYEMQDGTGEIQAYENFGQRCGQSQYRKFASLLMQNVRKGTRDMQRLLDAEAEDAFRQRKAYAKQLGEEAGTRLLLPMGMMLLLVFAILMLPAMLSLGM